MSSGEPGAARRAALRVSCLQNPSSEELAARLKTAEFVWADYDAPSDDDFAVLAEMLNLHPLAVQAAGTFPQRPKLDEYEGYMFVVVCGVDPGTASGGPLLREVNMIISGALFPAAGLAVWLTVLNRIDPLTYAVDPMRKIVFNHLTVSPVARHALDSGVTWWGWRVPTLLEVAIVALMGLAMLGVAIWEFSATE